MDYSLLIDRIKNYTDICEAHLEKKTIDVEEVSFLKLRDTLLGMGKILEEDFENEVYIINIPSGFASKNRAVVGIQLLNQKMNLVGYAKEGIINQHTASKAIDKIVKKTGRVEL